MSQKFLNYLDFLDYKMTLILEQYFWEKIKNYCMLH